MTWSAEKYFAKAELNWSRATALERGEPEFLLYVSFVLELMVRGSLCSVHPSLNASSDTESLMYANGQTPKVPAKTIAFNEAFSRVRRIVAEITQGEAEAIEVLAQARNSQLHDDADALSDVATDDIMPHVYSVFAKLAKAASIDLATVLGKEDAAHAHQVAQATARDRKRRVTALIQAHKDRFYGQDEETQQRLRKEAEPQSAHSISQGVHMRKRLCPACKANGVVAATLTGQSAPILKEDGIVVEVRVSPTLFECKACGLQIKGLDELMAAGFPHELKTSVYVDPVAHLAIDPMEYIDVHKVVREYLKEEEYGDE